MNFFLRLLRFFLSRSFGVVSVLFFLLLREYDEREEEKKKEGRERERENGRLVLREEREKRSKSDLSRSMSNRTDFYLY